MAVYTEDADGKRTLLIPDKTLSDVVNEKVEELKSQGLEVSPCVQEILGTQPVNEVGEEI